jgi:predicted metal-dependent phosphoesterase TrpH
MFSTQPCLVDLHTHTTASDGSLTPRQLVAEAKRLGLRAVAISDHDTITGVEEGLAAGRELDFEVVAGVELSTDFRDKTLHLLGYLFDPRHAPFAEKLAWAQEQRELRNARMVQRFRDLGVEMTLAEVEAEAGGGLIGRPHFAALLVKKGAVASFDDAFRIYLSRSGKAYLPKIRFSAPEAIGLIRDAGGLPVLAHPMLIGWTPLEIDDAIGELQAMGLAGVEALYTEHNPAQVAILLDIAHRRGLLTTGGSDYHGAAKPDTQLGRGRGDLAVPYAWLEAMKAAKGTAS